MELLYLSVLLVSLSVYTGLFIYGVMGDRDMNVVLYMLYCIALIMISTFALLVTLVNNGNL